MQNLGAGLTGKSAMHNIYAMPRLKYIWYNWDQH